MISHKGLRSSLSACGFGVMMVKFDPFEILAVSDLSLVPSTCIVETIYQCIVVSKYFYTIQCTFRNVINLKYYRVFNRKYVKQVNE